MFFKISVLAALATLSFGSPIESQATSYVSGGFGGQVNLERNGLGYESHGVAAPVITHHQIPTVVHNIVSPIIRKVPILINHEEHQEEEHEPAQYEFHYAVEDKHTGDIKSQKETRHGDAVQGEYSLKEADGTIRIVKYSADKKSGFNAVVIRKGHAAHPQVVHKEVKVKKLFVPIVDHHDNYQQIYSHY